MTFKVTMNKANMIDMSWLKKVRPGLAETDRELISIQALDIILRSAPFRNRAITVKIEFGELLFIIFHNQKIIISIVDLFDGYRQCDIGIFGQVGKSFFTQPEPGRAVNLGAGMDLWVGTFQSAILGWKPYFNVDGNMKIVFCPTYILHPKTLQFIFWRFFGLLNPIMGSKFLIPANSRWLKMSEI